MSNSTNSSKTKHVHLDEALTQKVAQLARLKLSSEETRVFTSQLGEILKYVEKLQEVDVTGVEPLTQPYDLVTPLREDVVKLFPQDEAGKPKVLQSAPEVMYDGFKVPPML